MNTIAILGGTGKEGPGLALRWASAGYKVIIGSRQAEKAQATATRLNAQLRTNGIEGMTNAEAARRAEVSVLTVEHSAHQAALESVSDALQGKVLVDATARVDFRHAKPPAPPSAGRIAQDLLGPGVKVVAAFQNVPAHSLGRNLGGQLDCDVMICADDLDAAGQVIQLAEAAGMRAYYAGGLDNAIVVEGLTALLIAMNRHYKSKAAAVQVTGIERK